MAYQLIETPLEDVTGEEAIAGLKHHGCLLLRHRATRVEDFMRFSDGLGRDFYRVGDDQGKQRVVGSERGRDYLLGYDSLFNLTSKGNLHALPLHGEMYHNQRKPPDLLWFYCQKTVVGSGGATWVCDGKALFRALPERLQQRFIGRRLAYTRWHAADVWPGIYGISELPELIDYLQGTGMSVTPHPDGAISTRFVSDALRMHLGEPCFVNNLMPFALRELREPGSTRANVRFEDGEALGPEELLSLEAAALALKGDLDWQGGDIAVIDNTRSLHGRGALPGVMDREVFCRFSEADFCQAWSPLRAESLDASQASSQVSSIVPIQP